MRVIAVDQLDRSFGDVVAFKAELRQQGRAILGTDDHTRLAGEGARGFGANAEIGVLIEHTARYVQRMCGVDRRQVLSHRQGRAPINHLR